VAESDELAPIGPIALAWLLCAGVLEDFGVAWSGTELVESGSAEGLDGSMSDSAVDVGEGVAMRDESAEFTTLLIMHSRFSCSQAELAAVVGLWAVMTECHPSADEVTIGAKTIDDVNREIFIPGSPECEVLGAITAF